MSLIDDTGQHPGAPCGSAASPAVPSREGDAARDARDRLLDATLAESFPASDPLPWTLGRRRTVPPER
jgi:hypothetical protein